MRLCIYFIWFVALIVFFGCTTNNHKKQSIIESNLSLKKIEEKNRQNKIIISGTSNDPKSLKHFLILNESYLFGTNHKYLSKIFQNDTLNIVLDSINEQLLLEVWVVGDTLLNAKIFVTPGDTLLFKIKNRKLRFMGVNAYYNNFYSDLYSLTPDYNDYHYTGDILSYKKTMSSIYTKKIDFFEEYIKKNKLTSNNFIQIVKADLKFQYLNALIDPKSKIVESINKYIGEGKGVLSIIDKEISKREIPFKLDDYIEDVTIEDFKMPELLVQSYFFKNSLDAFIRFYFVNNEFLNYSQEAFLAEKEFIQNNFDGEIENYAIARMIREYNVNGFGYSKVNINQMKELINEYKEKFSRPSYKEKMAEIEESLDNFNFKLSQDALLSKLINPIGDTTTLGEIYKRVANKIKVIDFWASWCPPCVREIKNAKYFKDNLANRNNVEWIYISIDRNYENWLKSSLKLQEYFNTENQYYLLGGKNSSLGKFLKVNGIPRYVILDKHEKIIIDNAPRPSDSLVFKKIIDEINFNGSL